MGIEELRARVREAEGRLSDAEAAFDDAGRVDPASSGVEEQDTLLACMADYDRAREALGRCERRAVWRAERVCRRGRRQVR